MATKKQKRLAGEAKAAREWSDTRQSGLKAQARDREYREKKAREAKAAAEHRRASTAANIIAQARREALQPDPEPTNAI